MTVRNAGNLECDLNEDFTLSSCSKRVVACDSTAPVGWVQCDKTGELQLHVHVCIAVVNTQHTMYILAVFSPGNFSVSS